MSNVSIIIPLMSVEPYKTQVHDCWRSLQRQTIESETIITVQPVEKYIRKNKILNGGLKQATGNIIFHCDADYLFPDKTFIERMVKKLSDCDVIYPMFYSDVYGEYKIADGGFFGRKEVLEEYGPLDESLIGIGHVTFPLLKWCLDNKKVYCSQDYLIELNKTPFVKRVKKRHEKTSGTKEMKKLVKETITILQGMGAWPQ